MSLATAVVLAGAVERRAVIRLPVTPTDARGLDVESVCATAGEAGFAATSVWLADKVRFVPAEPLSVEVFIGWLLT